MFLNVPLIVIKESSIALILAKLAKLNVLLVVLTKFVTFY